mmetsp:Transcript_17205/g.47679  ORF Transcript_17205/g.47679 Transcript_17205/m.47679 type:complete len:231 (+) Transcript_17205:309-1001(+)
MYHPIGLRLRHHLDHGHIQPVGATDHVGKEDDRVGRKLRAPELVVADEGIHHDDTRPDPEEQKVQDGVPPDEVDANVLGPSAIVEVSPEEVEHKQPLRESERPTCDREDAPIALPHVRAPAPEAEQESRSGNDNDLDNDERDVNRRVRAVPPHLCRGPSRRRRPWCGASCASFRSVWPSVWRACGAGGVSVQRACSAGGTHVWRVSTGRLGCGTVGCAGCWGCSSNSSNG